MPVVLPAWHDDLHFEAVSSRPAASKRLQNKNIQRLEDIFTDIRPAAKWATSRPAASSSNANSVVKTSSSNGVVKTPSSKNANGDVKAEKVLMFLPDSWPEADLRAEDTVSTAVDVSGESTMGKFVNRGAVGESEHSGTVGESINTVVFVHRGAVGESVFSATLGRVIIHPGTLGYGDPWHCRPKQSGTE